MKTNDNYIKEDFFTCNAPPKWFYTKNDVRKALNKVYNVYYDTDYLANLKTLIAMSLFRCDRCSKAVAEMDLVKLSKVFPNDEYILQREFADWRIERLPECRFDLWPRKWDGKAVLILDDIERKRNGQMLETEIRNNEIRLLLQFCSIPFVLKMRFTEFMQCIDFNKLSRHELKTLAWWIVGYFYTESKKMRTATTKTEFGFASDSVIRWSYDREEITNFLIEKTARYFELLAKRKKRTEKTLC